MYRLVLVCAFIVIVSGWCTCQSAENAEMSSARSKDLNATCINIGDCPTVDTDCQEKCGCDKRIQSTYDNETNNCEIDVKLLIKLLKEENNTEAGENAEMSSARSKNVNATCIGIGDCGIVDTDCLEKCGCDKRIPFTYDNGTNNCEINIKSRIKLLIMSLKEEYNTEDKNMSTEDDVDDMASRLRAEADRIFKGVIVSAFLFISCASVCTLTACIYCCRINYTDYQLKKSVKVLARKMGTKSQLKKPAAKTPTAPIAESCNVVVEDAGVFCV